MEKLKVFTIELLNIVTEANDIYLQKRKTKEKGDFYQEVKPFADRAREVCIQWQQEIGPFVQQGDFKYIHPPQVEAVVENIELVSVQAFFPETSYTRFKNYIESTSFLLDSLLNELG
ncbi:DUF1798 family protein [Bacillus sp. REN10]|uniref:DUF1798 family protein n=1 Tax=Bacillus sp. REN10 TaxID=2782541 RepID=UPI00193C2ED2|nr:DUF1798 family protein [Bacillus sp. REN10]